MNVHFANHRLERCAEQGSLAIRTWGTEVGRRYVQRVRLLQETRRVSDLYSFRDLDFHPLRENRHGQYGLRLTGQMRMVLTVEDDHTVTVEEVVNYHD